MFNQSQRDMVFNRARLLQLTIDGKPAQLCGRLCDYPTVRSDDGSVACEFAWETVAHCFRQREDGELVEFRT